MTTEAHPGDQRVQLYRARDAIHALAQVLQCIDPQRWNSLARPTPAALSALLFTLSIDLDAGLAAAGLSPET